MDEIKLADFITLKSGKTYCILNQKQIGGRYFATALTVPDKIAELKDSTTKILRAAILEGGEIGIAEYPETEEDYLRILSALNPPIN